jgi:hypothetical protein
MSDITEPQDAPGGAGRFVLPVLFGAVIALAGFSGYLFMQLNHVRADIAKLRESIMTEIANLREASSATTEANRRHLDTLREDLETARRNAAVAVGQAKQEALKHAETLAKQLQVEQQRQQQPSPSPGGGFFVLPWPVDTHPPALRHRSRSRRRLTRRRHRRQHRMEEPFQQVYLRLHVPRVRRTHHRRLQPHHRPLPSARQLLAEMLAQRRARDRRLDPVPCDLLLGHQQAGEPLHHQPLIVGRLE